MRLLTLCFALCLVHYVKQGACVCKAAPPSSMCSLWSRPAWSFAAGQDKRVQAAWRADTAVPSGLLGMQV